MELVEFKPGTQTMWEVAITFGLPDADKFDQFWARTLAYFGRYAPGWTPEWLERQTQRWIMKLNKALNDLVERENNASKPRGSMDDDRPNTLG